ncbi:hypothetical protein [Bradyrhizobium arachidis]|uniref:hypothetical protein n=1 Tax=Bradyrhizobium arachidis TaxID=858423 RepID=UPI0008E6A5F7|nr:hypothetical protein [Bradyrhizobium arachidis]SFV13457.1 hypothetical protein SAMN05192541_12020 [Bradyrhizobium arachidis]
MKTFEQIFEELIERALEAHPDLTEQDIAGASANLLSQFIPAVARDMCKDLKRRMPQLLARARKSDAGFEKRIFKRWRKPLDLLELHQRVPGSRRHVPSLQINHLRPAPWKRTFSWTGAAPSDPWTSQPREAVRLSVSSASFSFNVLMRSRRIRILQGLPFVIRRPLRFNRGLEPGEPVKCCIYSFPVPPMCSGNGSRHNPRPIQSLKADSVS